MAGGFRTLDVSRYDAVLFDLDGVLTDTARVHEEAWAATFSAFFVHIRERDVATFTSQDYRELVDGESRLDGVRNVLTNRQIKLPEGSVEDPAGEATAWALANAKDERDVALLSESGPHPFASSIRLVRELKALSLRVGVVSASRHCTDILALSGIGELFDTMVDGRVAAAMGLPGKPQPATYLEGAARLDVEPGRTVVVEDAVAGIEAAVAGGFGLAIGVDRAGARLRLASAGAGIVVSDLAQIALAGVPDRWVVEVERGEGLSEDRSKVGRIEALGTLANGYLGVRGASPWAGDDGVNYPGTYLAGVYNRLAAEINGEDASRESIVNIPNWLPMAFRIDDGEWVGEPGVRIRDHSVRLDLRRGLLVRECTTIDSAGRICLVRERRLVSMAASHLAAQELSVTATNWSGTLHVRAGIDTSVSNDQTVEEHLLPHEHLADIRRGTDESDLRWLTSRTSQSGILVAEAIRLKGYSAQTSREAIQSDPVRVATGISLPLVQRGRVTIEKIAAVYTSRDRAISEAGEAARAAVCAAPAFGELARDHEAAWARLWQRSELSTSLSGAGMGNGPGATVPVTSNLVRLQLFHLLQVASPQVKEFDVGIPARGLGGEGYLGHIFWDELFVFPVLDSRFPSISRALLRYRIRRLPAARQIARAAGHTGAVFPWQSGSDGRDQTPRQLFNPRTGTWMPDGSGRQRHVGLAVAYELWQHWQSTGDAEFFFTEGAEVFLEVARFFADLAVFDPSLSRWRILGVMGPDEFHDGYPGAEPAGIDDNAYTNVMTAWLLTRALELVALIRSEHRTEVLEQVSVSAQELAHWAELTQLLYVPFHDGVISQFHGYENLKTLDMDGYRARYGNIGRLDLILATEGDAVRDYQVAKQADTLMLFYLLSAEELRDVLTRLGYRLPAETILRTIDYYVARAAHGSSLSAVVHAWVQARGDRRGSWEQFRAALEVDFADIQG
ncbi:MAG: HAD-IA family hydrolase, partial [Leifsonia sp.]